MMTKSLQQEYCCGCGVIIGIHSNITTQVDDRGRPISLKHTIINVHSINGWFLISYHKEAMYAM